MAKKENISIDPGRIIISSLIGLMVFIILMSAVALFIKYEILPFNIMKIISKIILFLACIPACINARSKGRGETFLNSIITSLLIFGLVILMGTMNNKFQLDIAGVIICLLICILACYMALVKKVKNSRMHKRKHR